MSSFTSGTLRYPGRGGEENVGLRGKPGVRTLPPWQENCKLRLSRLR